MEKTFNHTKEPWLAVVLSFFFAGIGQIYAGRKWRGIILILTVVALNCFSIWSILSPKCDIFVSAGIYVAILIICIWNLFDAHKCARKANSDDVEAERQQVKDPWLALFLSKLIPGLGHMYLKKWILGIGFVVAVGILLIIGSKYLSLFVGLWAFFSMLVCYHAYMSAPIRRESSKKVISMIAIIILCSCLLHGFNRYAFRAYIVESFRVPTGSMRPTVLPGDMLLARKNNKYIPKRGDVVVFKSPKEPDVSYIKRIAELSGETLEIKNEILYINGQKVQQPALQNIKYPFEDYIGMEGEPYKVPEKHIFVIGDNSDNSYDSRDFGSIPLSDVTGKAYKIYWPLSHRGPIK